MNACMRRTENVSNTMASFQTLHHSFLSLYFSLISFFQYVYWVSFYSLVQASCWNRHTLLVPIEMGPHNPVFVTIKNCGQMFIMLFTFYNQLLLILIMAVFCFCPELLQQTFSLYTVCQRKLIWNAVKCFKETLLPPHFCIMWFKRIKYKKCIRQYKMIYILVKHSSN